MYNSDDVQKITKKRTRNMRRKYWELDLKVETKIITGVVSIIRYSALWVKFITKQCNLLQAIYHCILEMTLIGFKKEMIKSKKEVYGNYYQRTWINKV